MRSFRASAVRLISSKVVSTLTSPGWGGLHSSVAALSRWSERFDALLAFRRGAGPKEKRT